ncbi:beta-N-acetylhexosaminidase [Herbiconiux sp. CPCC 205763]|uniref:Beta-N-acetylhexosaminidase n=1 Tax=Herbiconiux aconitum TaxID=2970913 RepID=A0ABT2GPY6_9MICO|nr:beta-N-acetylhexosaminidase [Herbiconiux aconitum]MCS5718280.1 beta-N-acetylhexosaminidase [Herbiconiux aconitum]
MSRQHILGTLLPGFVGTTLPEWVERMLREGLGGVCLFHENVVSPTQLRELTDAIRAANPDALIAVDEEGGDVTRLHGESGAPFPGNAVLGRLDDLDATRAVASAVGAELRAAGVNIDFAPDVDVNSNPRNPVIGIRSFGSDPALVARHGAAWVEALQAQGVAASIKHFPGHGDTAQDSHLALPSVDVSLETLRERELQPFAAAVRAGAFTVMTSHILLPQLDPGHPATFSAIVLDGLLRDELGFDGVIVSDALDMVGASGETGIPTAAVQALAAGCDLLCIGTKNTEQQLNEIVDRVSSALRDGELTVARLAEATVRLRQLGERIRDAEARADGAGVPATGVPLGRVEAPTMPDVRRVASAFSIAPSVAAELHGSGWVVLRLDTVANIAVGISAWGPFAALEASGPRLPVIAVTEEDWNERIGHMPSEASLLVIGKDNQRRPWVVALVDELRTRHERVVSVDMGWPGDDPAYAGIATFGASGLVGAAFADLLRESGVRA